MHPSELIINLDSLRHNINVYRGMLKSSTKLVAVIKASAYGSGIKKVAKTLEDSGVNCFAVAFENEALKLKKIITKTPIRILNPQIQNIHLIVKHGFEPSINSLSYLKKISDSSLAKNKKLNIHINMNTGMNRLGLNKIDCDQIIKIVKQNPGLKVKTIYSHLSCSEDSSEDGYSKKQAKKYNAFVELLQKRLKYKVQKEILNSSGIARFHKLEFNSVRLGLGMHGIDGSSTIPDLKKVHTLNSKIIQLTKYPKDKAIGYTRAYITSKVTNVAVMPIGYADGFPFAAGKNGYRVLIKGKLAPIIGNVCMDLSMIDVTHIPNVSVGDTVTVFGEKAPLEELAKTCKTIPYEILCNLSPRTKRKYIQKNKH